MSTGTTSGRNRLVVPVAAAVIFVVIVAAILLTRGGDDAPAAPKATKSTAAAASTPSQGDITGSGDAPDAIAVSKATAARSAAVFGLAADIPKIDLEKFDSVTVVLGQDDGDVLWRLTTFRDARGAFITPELYLDKRGRDERFACASAAMRIKDTRLTVSIPLVCLDDPEKPLRARLEIKDRDGGEEKTTVSKKLIAPK
jgi:hypothetical protein